MWIRGSVRLCREVCYNRAVPRKKQTKTLHAHLDVDAVVQEIGVSFEDWARRCHEISLAIVKAGLVEGRVVRGSSKATISQHSWIVPLDFYDGTFIAKDHWIIDPTLWSYDEKVEGIWYGNYSDGLHRLHGEGLIWDYGRPGPPVSEVIELEPKGPLSGRAQEFLRLLGPLDARGWSLLLHSPVEGWPAREILVAADNTPTLRGVIPIDILGNYTDLNPLGLYLPGADPLDVEVS